MQHPKALEGDTLHRLLVDNIAELVALVDLDAIVLFASPAHERKLGYRPDELIGGALSSLLHPDDLDHMEDALRACGTGGRVDLGEFRLRHRAGRWVVLDGCLTAIDAGGTKLLLLTAHEVSARVRRVRAEHEFVANAAHELLTPLAAMNAAIEVLQSGAKEVPDERDAFLADLEREIHRLGRLAQALLVLARVQATGEAVSLHPVELSPLMRDIADRLRAESDVAIKVACSEELVVLAERDLLERALANLAHNAATHSAGRGIVLAARRVRDGRVEIEVRDTGSGMTPDEQAHAFDRFYRAGSRGNEGFGIGLAIVREVVRVLDGSVQIESKPGVGTAVRLHLPAAS